MTYLWLKLLHMAMIISWFAGLFYLPRIFVNLAMTQDNEHQAEYQRLLIMARKLFRFMTPIGILALVFGTFIVFELDWWRMGWVHVKLTLGLLLVIYHIYCHTLLRHFEQHTNKKSHVWFRYFNEIPVIIMFIAIYFAIFKPF